LSAILRLICIFGIIIIEKGKMRKLILVLFGCLCLCAVQAQTLKFERVQRPKVGLVLSGGGAKGSAHVGVLKVLEKAGIPIDYVVGTSMGSIVGGLYSIGYKADDLDAMIRNQDWTNLLTDRLTRSGMGLAEKEKADTYFFSLPLGSISRSGHHSTQYGLLQGQNLANLFSQLTVGYHDSIDFNRLPIPFACVATDMVKYEEIVFHSGYLTTAMRASMAIPAVFTPVRMGEKLLVDGGLKNNYPADIAKEMGADILIGVSVQDQSMKTIDDFKGSAAVLTKLIDVNCQNKFEENWAMTDIPIKVDVKGYSSASFTASAIDTLIRRGEEAGMQHWDELMQLKKKLGLADDYKPANIKRYEGFDVEDKVLVQSVNFVGIDESDQHYLTKQFKLHENDSLTIRQIENAVEALRGNLFYGNPSYQLLDGEKGYQLTIDAAEKKTSEVYVGVRFDNEEKVAVKANSVIPFHTKIPIKLQLTGRLGKRSMGRVDATFNPRSFKSFTLSYQYDYNDLNIYKHGHRDFNVTFHHHLVDAALLNLTGRNFYIDLLARYEYYKYTNTLSAISEVEVDDIKNSRLYSYHARIHFNTQDQEYFTTRGIKFSANYGLYTDDFLQYKGHQPFHTASVNWQASANLYKGLTLQSRLYGRLIWGDDIPFGMRNFVGGEFFGHYISQQLPFAGIGNLELAEDVFAGAHVTLQQYLGKNHYVSATASVSEEGRRIKYLLDDDPHIGFRLGYAYNSFLGPLGVSAGWSNRSKKVYFYINLGFEF